MYWNRDLPQENCQHSKDDEDYQVYPPEALAMARAGSLLGSPDGGSLGLLGVLLLHVRHGNDFDWR